MGCQHSAMQLGNAPGSGLPGSTQGRSDGLKVMYIAGNLDIYEQPVDKLSLGDFQAVKGTQVDKVTPCGAKGAKPGPAVMFETWSVVLVRQ